MQLIKFKNQIARLLVLFLLLLFISFSILSGCAQGTQSSAPAGTSETSAASTTATTTSSLPAETSLAPTPTIPPAALSLNPLTGVPLKNPKAAGKRPVAIMINNIKQALPQIGIGEADLIYEMPVEGTITRLMAVFADVATVPELGSIRSARHDYIDLAGGLDAIFVHIGASNIANAQFSSQKTNHIDLHVYPAAYWRDSVWLKQRGYEHSVKTTGSRLLAAIATSKYRTSIRENQASAFQFSGVDKFVPADGQAAGSVSVPYSTYVTATFTYNAQTRLYSKGQFGTAHVDMATGQSLKFTNVFLIMTKITVVSSSGHKDALLEKGSGYYISGGKAMAINWRKGTTLAPFVFTDKSGKVLQVNNGKSYIGIVSDQRKIGFKA